MDSWWELGENSGYRGSALDLNEVICPFCYGKGKFKTVAHFEKNIPNGSKSLHFDTLECIVCKGYVMCLWSADGYMQEIYDFRVLPWPLRVENYPKHWPEGIGRFWIQAHRNLADENWDAAAIMARSALQAALRDQKAIGKTLFDEINDLSSKGFLPPLMKLWAHTVRELAKESAHPQPDPTPIDPKDAKDVVRFLDFLMEYLYNLPLKINQYHERKGK